MRILIVEDDRATIRHYTNRLVDLGVDHHVAESRIEAIRLLSSFSYDCAVVDLHLSDQIEQPLGLEVLDYINEISEGTLVFIVTASTDYREIDRSHKGKPIDVVFKNDEDYYSIIDRLIDTRKNRKFEVPQDETKLKAYLAMPEKTPYWEDFVRGALGSTHERSMRALWGAFRGFVPVLRRKNTLISLTGSSELHSVAGLFWSKKVGSPIWVSIHGERGEHQLPREGSLGALLHQRADPKHVAISVWALEGVARESFSQDLSDISWRA